MQQQACCLPLGASLVTAPNALWGLDPCTSAVRHLQLPQACANKPEHSLHMHGRWWIEHIMQFVNRSRSAVVPVPLIDIDGVVLLHTRVRDTRARSQSFSERWRSLYTAAKPRYLCGIACINAVVPASFQVKHSGASMLHPRRVGAAYRHLLRAVQLGDGHRSYDIVSLQLRSADMTMAVPLAHGVTDSAVPGTLTSTVLKREL